MIIIPTLICWLVGYLTLLLPLDDLENRGQVSVPVLLILVTLFGSISVKDDYPETTNFKYIDAWFLFYMFDTLLIIAYHLLICHMSRNWKEKDIVEIENGVVTGQSRWTVAVDKAMKKKEKKIKKIDGIVKIVVFVTSFFFNAWYFLVTVSDTFEALDVLDQ